MLFLIVINRDVKIEKYIQSRLRNIDIFLKLFIKMPLIHVKKTTQGGIRTLWRITETPEFLLQELPSSQDLTEFKLISNTSRKREWLAVRILAYQTAHLLGLDPKNIIKNQWNAPEFEHHTLNISFSHSKKYAAVLAHPTKRIGIDIESSVPEIKRIIPHILGEDEMKWVKTTEQSMQVWCAKEAVYKFYMKRAIDFRKDIHICQQNGKLVAILHKNAVRTQLNVEIEQYECQTIAYCFENQNMNMV